MLEVVPISNLKLSTIKQKLNLQQQNWLSFVKISISNDTRLICIAKGNQVFIIRSTDKFQEFIQIENACTLEGYCQFFKK